MRDILHHERIVRKKWIRFSAPDDALFKEGSIGLTPKVDTTFESDALAMAGVVRGRIPD
jgi:hypothetical protein